jgi:antitoxin HigA-1
MSPATASKSLTVAQAAAGLGVSRKTLSLLLNGHAGISPETLALARSAGVAVRLSKAFGRTPESWLQLQMNYDLAQINQQSDRIQVTRFGRPETELMPAGA